MSAQTAVTQTAAPSLLAKFAARFGVEPNKMMTTLKATAFRQRSDRQGNVREPSNEEMMSLLVIADQFRLNPFTRELFAYLDPKSGAIIPIVSVDGWIRIINEQPTLRSLSFNCSPETTQHKGKTVHEWMEIEIVRSDRDKPIIIREYFAEVVRTADFALPWDTHPNRLHRHKTLIQGARVAFGFGGIYDDDEGQRIIEGQSYTVSVEESPKIAAINEKIKTAAQTTQTIDHDTGEITEQQEADLDKVAGSKPAKATSKADSRAPTVAELGDLVNKAQTTDEVDLALSLMPRDLDEATRKQLLDDGTARRGALATKDLL
jgi:hypothetical protein